MEREDQEVAFDYEVTVEVPLGYRIYGGCRGGTTIDTDGHVVEWFEEFGEDGVVTGARRYESRLPRHDSQGNGGA